MHQHYIEDDDGEEFQSLPDNDEYFNRGQSIINLIDNRPTAYVKQISHSIQNRVLAQSCYEKAIHSEQLSQLLSKSQFVDRRVQSDHSDCQSKSDIRSPLLQKSFEIPLYQQYKSNAQKRRQVHNRIEMLLQRRRPQRQKEVQQCSLDTSAALIRLMVRKRFLRYFMNIYIWINIILRVTYFALILYYAIDERIQDSNFYYWLFGTFGGIRVFFCLIIYKLLHIGENTRDKKIKIIYETYITQFDEINTQIRKLQKRADSMSVRTAEEEEELQKIEKEIKKLNKWLFRLKTYVILIPPELSFIFLKKQSNGFFQVQNFIMKSLEIYFFTPPFVYFLYNSLDLEITFQDFFQNPHKIYNICAWVLLIDVGVYWLLILSLLFQSNRRKQVAQI